MLTFNIVSIFLIFLLFIIIIIIFWSCCFLQCQVDLLKNKFGFDEAFNYKEEPDLDAALKRFDNFLMSLIMMLKYYYGALTEVVWLDAYIMGVVFK